MPINAPRSNENPNGYCVDTLVALIENGPLWDGDVPSKSGRNGLIESGCAVRVISKGEDGYTAATYLGRELYKAHFGGDTLNEAIANRKKQVEARNNQPMYHPV